MSGQASGGLSQPGGRKPPPRGGGPAKRPVKRKPAKRRAWWLKPSVLGPLVVLVVALIVVIVVTNSGGSKAAVGYKAGTLAVYGAKGPEGIPLEVGPVLAPPNPSLTSATIDSVVCGATESTTVHYHAHLMIFVDGQPRSVPLAIGMVPPAIIQQSPSGEFAGGSKTCLFWLHTHAQDGIVHIEAPASRVFVLRQFFDIWGQPIGSGQVGPAKGTVTATLNGKPYTGDPGNIVLSKDAQIVLNVGQPVVSPPAISFSGTQL